MQLKIRIMADILMYFLTAFLLTISKSLLKRSIKWFDRFPFSSSISPLVRPAHLLIYPLRSLSVSGGVLQRYKNIDCFSVTETHLSAQVSDNEIGYRLGRQAQTKGAMLLSMFAIVCRYLDEGIWLEIHCWTPFFQHTHTIFH